MFPTHPMCHQRDLWEEEYINKVLAIKFISLHPLKAQPEPISSSVLSLLVSPEHSMPPLAGAGLLQSLVLLSVPPPQVTLQDHVPHVLHMPSTGPMGRKVYKGSTDN